MAVAAVVQLVVDSRNYNWKKRSAIWLDVVVQARPPVRSGRSTSPMWRRFKMKRLRIETPVDLPRRQRMFSKQRLIRSHLSRRRPELPLPPTQSR